jgi:protoporphyrinogen oxidase
MQVIVLGAGLAGLAAAVRAAREGAAVVVLESEAHVGGMVRSEQVGPWHLDHGPHRFWSRDPHVLALAREMMGADVVESERRSQILLMGQRFAYPLQPLDVARKLPAGVLVRGVRDWARERVQQRLHPDSDTDFEAWTVKRFGRTLYDVFFGPYTEKAWGAPCNTISADWAAQRISQSGLYDAVKSMLVPSLGAHQRSLAARFLYPKSGGIGSLAQGFARHLHQLGGRIELHTTVERVETRADRVFAVSGCGPAGFFRYECDAVISTIPLPRLAQAVDPALGATARTAAEGLRHRAVRFAHVEVARPQVSPNHWIYLPERELEVHRVTEFKNFSAHGLPGDRTALCAEITCAQGDELWNLNDAHLHARVERDLVRAGLVQPGETTLLASTRLAHAYPFYDLGYKARVETTLKALKALSNLRSTGRQGLHRYNNMDHSIAMGWHAAKGLARLSASAPVAQHERVGTEQVWFG